MDGSALLTVARFVSQDARDLFHAKKEHERAVREHKRAIRYAWIARADYREWRDWSDDRKSRAEHADFCWQKCKQARRNVAALRARLAEPVH